MEDWVFEDQWQVENLHFYVSEVEDICVDDHRLGMYSVDKV